MAIHNSTAAQYSNNMRVTTDDDQRRFDVTYKTTILFNAKFYIQ